MYLLQCRCVHCALAVAHSLIVVDSLITPVILGMDSLQGHEIILNCSSLVQIPRSLADMSGLQKLMPVVAAVDQANSQCCAAITAREMAEEVVIECHSPVQQVQVTRCLAMLYQ